MLTVSRLLLIYNELAAYRPEVCCLSLGSRLLVNLIRKMLSFCRIWLWFGSELFGEWKVKKTEDLWHILIKIRYLCPYHNLKSSRIMDSQKVDAFIMANGKYFHDYQISAVREFLLAADDSKWPMIQALQFKDPTITLIISIIGGSLGIDRFFLGDMGLGVIKLITCGGAGIWTIVDWFLVMGVARDRNMQKLQTML